MRTDLLTAPDESAQRHYLRLCLSSRWSPSALVEAGTLSAGADFDWAAVRQCAWDEGVALLWYDRVRDRDQVPRAIETELQAAYRETALRNAALFCERDRVLRELHDAGIDAILLKGAALAEAVYGDIALRPMSDIDLLVHAHSVSAVVQCLARAGYFAPTAFEPQAGTALEYDNEVAVSKPGEARYRFDVHWTLLGAPYYQRRVPSDWFWATAQPMNVAAQHMDFAAQPIDVAALPASAAAGTSAGLPARMLGPEAQVLHLAAHLILQHHGHGLKWWQDAAEVVWAFRQQIDWDLLCERAVAYDLVLPVQRVLLDLVEHWRMPIPIEAVEQLRALQPSSRERQMYARLTVEHRPPLKRYWGDLLSVAGWRERLRYVRRKLFPAAAYMRWRYALRWPWLLPLAYPYRWLRGLWPK